MDNKQLDRIASALERLAPEPAKSDDMAAFEGYIWQSDYSILRGIRTIQRLPLNTLIGIDQQKHQLLKIAAPLPPA